MIDCGSGKTIRLSEKKEKNNIFRLPYPDSQLANQEPCLLCWYPAISSHWPDMAIIMLTWPKLGTVNTLSYLFVRFSGISGPFGFANGTLAWLRLAKVRTMFDQTRLICGRSLPKKVRLGILIKHSVLAHTITEIMLKMHFYNNCLISRSLIGSFLSLLRVQMDKILIYTSFQVQLLAVKLATF